MSLHQKFREFWRTESWLREQSAQWAAHHYSGESREVAARVIFCLLDSLAEDPKNLSPASGLYTDIDLDDFNDVFLLDAVAEELGVAIPEHDIETILTLGQLIAYIHERLPKGAA